MQASQILWILDTCADGLGESAEKLRERGGELVTTDPSTMIAKPFLNPIVVEDGQRDGRLADPTGTYEGNGFEVLSKTNDLLDQVGASETCPRWWWEFTVRARCEYQTQKSLVSSSANLV